MRKLTIIIIFISSFTFLRASVIDLTSFQQGDDICDLVTEALNDPDNYFRYICFLLPANVNRRKPFEVTLSCVIEVKEYSIINIPSGLKINLTSNGGFQLSDNGSIKGEQYDRSTITVDSLDDSGIVMTDSCVGCSISDIKVIGDGDSPGIKIESDAEGNSIESVIFEELKIGLEVGGNCNKFTDLVFHKVGIDAGGNCGPKDNNPQSGAVILTSADDNSFNNILHTTSDKATTVKFSGSCNFNKFNNISLEHEGSGCIDNPGLFVEDGTICEGNYISTNFNGGMDYIEDKSDFCQNNVVLPDICLPSPSSFQLDLCGVSCTN